jgi:ferritin-like metal-binding protein YciE
MKKNNSQSDSKKRSTNDSHDSGSSLGSKQSSGNEGLMKLFEDELKDIYWAEKALTKALPKMMDKATSEELVQAMEDHLEVTEEHVSRAEQIFEIMGKTPKAKKCEAMAGLIKEGEEIMEETEEGPVRDAGIILAAQKVEHYEIATYGTLKTFASLLGLQEVVDILSQTLNEEKEADEKLTEIAVSSINIEALNEGEENNEEDGEEGTEEEQQTSREPRRKPVRVN